MNDMPTDIPYEGEVITQTKVATRPANGDSMSAFEASAPSHTGQGTQVEQARAIAEVRAAVLIAMERPRNATAAIAEMRTVCRIQGLADRAFFAVSRGNQTVNGESIHLARELARCWGNITYGVKELVRDDVRKQSEILAYAWDMQTNARSELVFVIPHQRDTRGGKRALTGTQEIYENNASFSGRRLRECIFAVLPVWFKSEASDLCRYTLEHGGGKPIEQRRADCAMIFEGLGVTVPMLEKRLGRPAAQWLAEDLANLGILAKSLKRNEVTREEAFPDEVPAPKALPENADGFEKAASGKRDVKKSAATLASYIAAIEASDDEGTLVRVTQEPAHREFVRGATKEEGQQIEVALAAQRRGFAVTRDAA